MSPCPVVTAVIVTYNSRHVVADCLRSLPGGFDGIDYEVTVADNGSSDDTLEVVREVEPNAMVVPIGSNRGYAAGVNAAIEAATATEAVFVLNPDVRLSAGSVQPLLEALRQPSTGIAVPKLLEEDGSLALSLRREPTLLRTAAALIVGVGLAGRIGTFGEVITSPGDYNGPATCDWASGAAMLVSRSCLTMIGPWDESFFLYSEETDFALRAKDAGLVLRYVPDSVVVHLGGDMTRDPRLWSMATVNRIRLFRRRNGPVKGALFTALVVLYEGLRGATGSPTHLAGVRAVLFPSARPAEIGTGPRVRVATVGSRTETKTEP